MTSCCIVVPVYRQLHWAEIGLVRHNLKMLDAFPVVLIGGQDRGDLLAETRSALADYTPNMIELETFDDRFFASVSGYSDLLLTRAFFERFSGYEYLLICQHDAIVLKPELQDWLEKGYAFVGAPMFRGYHIPERPLIYLQSLNGGLSLRHVPSALSVLRNVIVLRRGSGTRMAEKLGLFAIANAVLALIGHRRIVLRKDGLNEDIFWTRDVPAVFPDFRVPQPDSAARFAFETCPSDLFERTRGILPFGCHAFERYEPTFWLTHAPQEIVPYIRILTPTGAEEGR